jgi:hypothetical protein
MGAMSDFEIGTWQKRAGLILPSPAECQRWRELQDICFLAIKLAELEISGIREGDSSWHGGDVVGGILGELKKALAHLERERDLETQNLATPAGDGCPF